MQDLLIYNRQSGKGVSEKIFDKIVETIKLHHPKLKVYKTEKNGDAYNIVYKNIRDLKNIFVMGGDGTINDVINAIANKNYQPKVYIIPNGTMNDLSRNLNLHKNPLKAIDNIENYKIRNNDVMKINNQYAIYGIAIGRFASTSYMTPQASKRKYGKLAYFYYARKDLKQYRPINMTIQYNGTTIKGKFALALITNSNYIAGFKVTKSKLNNGYAKLILIKDKKEKGSISSTLTIIKMFMFGIESLRHNKLVTIIDFDKINILFDNYISIVIDGEEYIDKSITIEVIKNKIQLAHNNQ